MRVLQHRNPLFYQPVSSRKHPIPVLNIGKAVLNRENRVFYIENAVLN